MNRRILDYKEKISQFWKNTGKKNKRIYLGTFISLVVILTLLIFITRTNFVPLYPNHLSQREIGEIKGVLDQQGFADYKISSNGTQILVPEEAVPDLIVNLASAGLPKGGTISFADQTKDLSFGATDRELEAIEREVIQAQLANLFSKISGVTNAEVMISLPKESVFIRPSEEDKASASIILSLEPGYSLERNQIKALYHLASKSIPNLPQENIVITDQYGEILSLASADDQSIEETDSYENQRKIKQRVEEDIQRSIQQMLGTMLGQDKVLVQTFVKMNFDKVKPQESLVQPANGETNEGIAVSVEKVTKSYSGEGNMPNGTLGTNEEDVITGDTGDRAGETNEYEEIQDRVNYEVNRITREIIESPYTIQDLTINVGVEPPDPKNPASLTQETQESIKSIIANVVRTAVDGQAELGQEDINNRITVFPKEFLGKTAAAEVPKTKEIASFWNYVLAGILAVVLVFAVILLFKYVRRKKNQEQEPASEVLEPQNIIDFEQAMSKQKTVQNEINDLAGKNTEEFVDLLRYWLKEEKEG